MTHGHVGLGLRYLPLALPCRLETRGHATYKITFSVTIALGYTTNNDEVSPVVKRDKDDGLSKLHRPLDDSRAIVSSPVVAVSDDQEPSRHEYKHSIGSLREPAAVNPLS